MVRGMKAVEASVGAVTSLTNELFVAVYDERQIRVYDADDLQLLRCLPVDGLGSQVRTTYDLIVRLFDLSGQGCV